MSLPPDTDPRDNPVPVCYPTRFWMVMWGSEPPLSYQEFPMTTPRVLVVEDDDSVRLMLHEGLHRDGFDVVVASNLTWNIRDSSTSMEGE